jgi:hypothetical protein
MAVIKPDRQTILGAMRSRWLISKLHRGQEALNSIYESVFWITRASWGGERRRGCSAGMAEAIPALLERFDTDHININMSSYVVSSSSPYIVS